MSEDIAGTCQECGASVYKQHLSSGIARYEGDKLMCAPCVADYERSHDAAASGVAEVFEPIELDGSDDEVRVDLSQSRIHVTSTSTLGNVGGWDDSKFERQLDPRAMSATRCRTFHSKLSQAALEFMDNQINEWLDKQGNVTVKFVTSTIGIFEGKHAEPNLFMTLFY